MVLTHHVTDDTGGFFVGLVRREAVFIHRVEDAAVHRLQAVAHVRQGAADDDRHRIGEIALPHLLFDGDGRNLVRIGRRQACLVVVLVGHKCLC